VDVFGLPLHPLVVHAAVVLIPLACLGAILVIVSGRVRDRYGWLTVAFAAAAALASIVAKVSGETFAAHLNIGSLIATHEFYGGLMPYPSVALALALPAALLLRGRSSAGWVVTMVLTLVAAVAGLVLVALTGHAGATAVWGG
jgi:uncharacterized membrane protein